MRSALQLQPLNQPICDAKFSGKDSIRLLQLQVCEATHTDTVLVGNLHYHCFPEKIY